MLGAEDFGAFAQVAPGFYWFLNAPVDDNRSGAPNHSPMMAPILKPHSPQNLASACIWPPQLGQKRASAAAGWQPARARRP